MELSREIHKCLDTHIEMTIEELYIYETAHNADSVDAHLDELADWGISPDFIGLELPTDGQYSGLRPIFKHSPTTAFVLYLVTKLQAWLHARGAANASRGDAEYEAGRRFADELDVPVKNVDRNRSDVFAEYFTWPRRLRDTLLFGGIIATVLFALGLLLASVIGPVQQGITVPTVGIALICLVAASGSMHLALALFGRIGNAFLDGIRDARDEAMFATTLKYCHETGGETALIIAGKRHSRGLSELAADHEVDSYTRSAPSIKSIDGDSFGLQEAKTVYLED